MLICMYFIMYTLILGQDTYRVPLSVTYIFDKLGSIIFISLSVFRVFHLTFRHALFCVRIKSE